MQATREPSVRPQLRLNRLRASEAAAAAAAASGALTARPSGVVRRSLFGQTWAQLACVEPARLRQSERPWTVVLEGEGAEDCGGPYRESMSQVRTPWWEHMRGRRAASTTLDRGRARDVATRGPGSAYADGFHSSRVVAVVLRAAKGRAAAAAAARAQRAQRHRAEPGAVGAQPRRQERARNELLQLPRAADGRGAAHGRRAGPRPATARVESSGARGGANPRCRFVRRPEYPRGAQPAAVGARSPCTETQHAFFYFAKAISVPCSTRVRQRIAGARAIDRAYPD